MNFNLFDSSCFMRVYFYCSFVLKFSSDLSSSRRRETIADHSDRSSTRGICVPESVDKYDLMSVVGNYAESDLKSLEGFPCCVTCSEKVKFEIRHENAFITFTYAVNTTWAAFVYVPVLESFYRLFFWPRRRATRNAEMIKIYSVNDGRDSIVLRPVLSFFFALIISPFPRWVVFLSVLPARLIIATPRCWTFRAVSAR